MLYTPHFILTPFLWDIFVSSKTTKNDEQIPEKENVSDRNQSSGPD